MLNIEDFSESWGGLVDRRAAFDIRHQRGGAAATPFARRPTMKPGF
jgi:hypothetical protein